MTLGRYVQFVALSWRVSNDRPPHHLFRPDDPRPAGGRKTQTRRVLKPQPEQSNGLWTWNMPDGASGYPEDVFKKKIGRWHPLPYEPGDRLWVREAWQPHSLYADRAPRNIPPSIVFYRADGGHSPALPWLPSIHMPIWASRLTLVVTDVLVQRLQDISEADARAEGISRCKNCGVFHADGDEIGVSSARWAFERLWTSIYGPGAWDANPWVVAVSFTVHEWDAKVRVGDLLRKEEPK
jgi:hypothetical protein